MVATATAVTAQAPSHFLRLPDRAADEFIAPPDVVRAVLPVSLSAVADLRTLRAAPAGRKDQVLPT